MDQREKTTHQSHSMMPCGYHSHQQRSRDTCRDQCLELTPRWWSEFRHSRSGSALSCWAVSHWSYRCSCRRTTPTQAQCCHLEQCRTQSVPGCWESRSGLGEVGWSVFWLVWGETKSNKIRMRKKAVGRWVGVGVGWWGEDRTGETHERDRRRRGNIF